MPKTSDERDDSNGGADVRCEIRWPTNVMRRFRHHVELVDQKHGEAHLRNHLEYCLPGKDSEIAREAELRNAKAVLHIYGDHPDVEAGKRRATDIWLWRMGVKQLEPIAGSWEENRLPEGALEQMAAAEIARVKQQKRQKQKTEEE